MNQFDLGYCIGLYEGEGCVGCYPVRTKQNGKTYEYYYLRFAMHMTDSAPLYAFQEYMDIGTIRGPYRKGNGNKSVYTFDVTSAEEIKKIMRLMYDYLSPRRQEQWDEALKLYEDNRNRESSILPEG